MERVGGDETRTEMDGMEVESGLSWKKVEVGRGGVAGGRK